MFVAIRLVILNYDAKTLDTVSISPCFCVTSRSLTSLRVLVFRRFACAAIIARAANSFTHRVVTLKMDFCAFSPMSFETTHLHSNLRQDYLIHHNTQTRDTVSISPRFFALQLVALPLESPNAVPSCLHGSSRRYAYVANAFILQFDSAILVVFDSGSIVNT